jgi:DeoR family transcriptional regulator of aga operon
MSVMRQEDRLGRILERLAVDGSVGVSQLAADLGVSTASVRRDLQLLEQQRLLSRTHGGAVASGLIELPLRYKGGRHVEEKRRIAATAARRADGVATVGFTGGTTTTEVARVLMTRQGLTVVTNALNIASELALRPELKLIVTGGTARSESYELVGPLADLTLDGLNVDVAFVGVDGISVDAGLTTYHEVEAHTNRRLIGRAARVVVVADGSKVGRRALARIAGLDDIDELITDGSADPDELSGLLNAGVVITTV